MEIKRNNIVIADVFLKNTSYTLEEINGDFYAYLEFDVRQPFDFNINDYIDYAGNRYFIRYKESIVKAETSLGYSYQITLYHEIYRMQDIAFFMYDNSDPNKPVTFNKHFNTFTGTADAVLDLIVKSMNRISSDWTKGTCIVTEPVIFDFKDKMCSDVINDLITAYGFEYWVDGKTLHYGKRELPSGGLILQQGAGFRQLSVKSVDNTPPITRLYAYGGDSNINANEYGSDYIMMRDNANEKILYLEKNTNIYGITEAIIQFPDVFPKKSFGVTEIIPPPPERNRLEFKSDDLTALNLLDCLIDGVDAIITFQTGALAGYDFTFRWDNIMKIVSLNQISEENALSVPGDINFAVNDIFIITGIKLPQQYIENAEVELKDEAQKYLDERCIDRVQLDGVCDEIYFAEKDINLKCGQLVGVLDNKLNVNREIRITSLKRYMENNNEIPYRYEITISDFLANNGFRQIVNDVKRFPSMIFNRINNLRTLNGLTFGQLKEAVAVNLGYSNYNELVLAAKEGQTIIDGGFINTNLIEADMIVTEALVSNVLAAIFISSQAIITNNLHVVDGAKIGGFKVDNDNLATLDDSMVIDKAGNITWFVNKQSLRWRSPENIPLCIFEFSHTTSTNYLMVEVNNRYGSAGFLNNNARMLIYNDAENQNEYGARFEFRGTIRFTGYTVGEFGGNIGNNRTAIRHNCIIRLNSNITLPLPSTDVTSIQYFENKQITLINTSTATIVVSGLNSNDTYSQDGGWIINTLSIPRGCSAIVTYINGFGWHRCA